MANPDTSNLPPPNGADPVAAARAVDAQDAQQGGAVTPADQQEPTTQEDGGKSETDFQADIIAQDIVRDQAFLEQLSAQVEQAEANAEQSRLDRISAYTALAAAEQRERALAGVVVALNDDYKRTVSRLTTRRKLLADVQEAQMGRRS